MTHRPLAGSSIGICRRRTENLPQAPFDRRARRTVFCHVPSYM
jgi:hypothetical protein